ncbi:hypothetical protein L3Y34_019267 [Caenorhabditis briggsae]|nr:hypothetical protein L3Y34_019267 [Caenorhabditis briggsae]
MSVILPQPSGGVWVGVKRVPRCIGQHLTPACNKTHSFYWTDGSANGYEAMKFQPNEPDNNGGNENCALLMISYGPKVPAEHPLNIGQMIDVPCSQNANSYWPPGSKPRQNRAYVCGRRTPGYG